MRNSTGRQPLQSGVVIHVVPMDLAAVPVTGVLAVAHVRDYHDVWRFLLDGADCPLNDAILCIGTRRLLIFFSGDAEENHAADPERLHLAALSHDAID